MRNFLAFIFWYSTILVLLAASVSAVIASMIKGISSYDLGRIISQLLGKWLLLIPWFATFAGWYFGFLPGFKKNERQIPGKNAESEKSESD